MEKDEFLRTAPAYYYAATAIALESTYGYFSLNSVKEYYRGYQEEAAIDFLAHDELVKRALDQMLAKGAVSELPDPFGESLYQKTDQFNAAVIEPLKADTSGPYYKNESANNRGGWMRGALAKINELYFSLGVSPKDFEQEPPDEWAPIPLEQSDPVLQDAIVALDRTIEQVEQSNGYADKHSEERRYVLDGLKQLSHTLKTATSVSARYLKTYGIELLKKVRDRFTGGLIDISAKTAIDALLHLVKEKAAEFLTWLLS
ncbi:hypothetical protein [Bradyrhizobium sp. LB11.1]|uniref:hypothetical protein n=1 Tax=Bradyrhizobium sp. LB11.1 TaxID=3156326 RepID=UPI003394ADA5